MCSIYRSAKVRKAVLTICLLLLSFNKAWADSAAVRVINTAGGGEVNIVVRNISDNQPAAGGLITWSNIEAGNTAWKIANQYIELSQHDLPVSWGIQIYTDNENSSAAPKYTGTKDPAGLVKVNNTLMALPMAWRITDSLLHSAGLTNPQERPDAEGFVGYLWHFIKDKNTPDDETTTPEDETFVNGEDYVTLWNQSGIAWNEGGRAHNPKKAYIYLAAKFTMASVNAEYKTSLLTIEAYHGISLFPIYLYKDAPKTEWPDEEGATLENHFFPSGWFNYNDSHKIITVDSKCKEVAPYSGTHCFKIEWNGNSGPDGKWGGVMWLEPEDIWTLKGSSPTHNGYDLRDADYLSFWARTNSGNVGLKIKVYFGNTWDSCGQSPPLWRTPLTTTWQPYIVPILGKDMSNVTGGFAMIFDKDHDPNPDGCIIYLDEIKFDKF